MEPAVDTCALEKVVWATLDLDVVDVVVVVDLGTR